MTKKSSRMNKLVSRLKQQALKEVSSVKKQVKNSAKKMASEAITGVMSTAMGSLPPPLRSGATEVANRIIKLWGSGDYHLGPEPRSNTLLKPSNSITVLGNDVRIRHREFIGEVSNVGTTSPFLLTNNVPVNAGLASSFPFLAQLAANYENYSFKGLVFEYVSTVSPYQTTNMGSVILSWQDNPDASPYSSKIVMENSEGAVSGRPDQSILYGVECANPRFNSFLTRTGTTTKDLGIFDFGIFQVATQSTIAGVLGEIWVSYDVVLSKPRLYSTPATTFVVWNTPTGATKDLLFSTTAPTKTYSSGRMSINFDTATSKITLGGTAPGDIISVAVLWAGTTLSGAYGPTVTGLTLVTSTYLGNAFFGTMYNSTTSGQCTLVYSVNNTVTPSTQPTIIGAVAAAASVTSVSVEISLLPSSILL